MAHEHLKRIRDELEAQKAKDAAKKGKKNEPTRREFIYLATAATASAGVGCAAWPFVQSLAPTEAVKALSSVEVDVSQVEIGQSITVKWQGKAVFIKRRSDAEIKQAEAVAMAELPDPQSDQDRVKKKEWLVVVGICTHLGCIPKGQKLGDVVGDYGGWYCPCHGSHYDTSGRIRKGPAPKNLEVPYYEFINDTTLRIGKEAA